MKRLLQSMALWLLLLASLPIQASGGVALGQTRVIFSEGDRAQSLTVLNSGDRAFLIQARVQATPDGGEASQFIVTPPLHSLKGGSSQMLRILRQDGPLPADRESLFYLAIGVIPAQTTPLVALNRVSVGMRFVVKLFYRPAGLAALAPESACQLVFRQTAGGLRIQNPTAYYQTLGRLTINGQAVELAQQPVMVSPLAHMVIPTGQTLHSVTWQTVTDAGGLSALCRQVAGLQ